MDTIIKMPGRRSGAFDHRESKQRWDEAGGKREAENYKNKRMMMCYKKLKVKSNAAG